jgi:Photosynthetic reaction centre cytochrome C subunit
MRKEALLVAIAALWMQPGCTQTPPAPAPPIPVSTASGAVVVATDTVSAVRQQAVEVVLQRIAGRENELAGDVFENVRVLRDVPAKRFVEIMNDGFGHGLGVGCAFCHVPGKWASDERPNKNTARNMVLMVNRLNLDLRTMPNLPDASPRVGCITCHRMAAKPLIVESSR